MSNNKQQKYRTVVRKDIECTHLTEALHEVQGERDHYFNAWRAEERQSVTLIETIRKLRLQQAQGRDGRELVAAEVQADTLNPELDERNYQVRPCSAGSEFSNENAFVCWKSWSRCITGSMWTPSLRTRTAHEAAAAIGPTPPLSLQCQVQRCAHGHVGSHMYINHWCMAQSGGTNARLSHPESKGAAPPIPEGFRFTVAPKLRVLVGNTCCILVLILSCTACMCSCVCNRVS